MVTIKLFVILTVVSPVISNGATVTPNEMQSMQIWVSKHFKSANPHPPFSFIYGGVHSNVLLPTWNFNFSEVDLDTERKQYTLRWIDSGNSGLEVRCKGIEYKDFPTIEWTVYFQNNGKQNTAILSDILALDASILKTDQKEDITLYHFAGDFNKAKGYQPFQSLLKCNDKKQFAPWSGRPTNGKFPYFNLASKNEGVIAVVGWPGQWSAEFTNTYDNGLTVRAGQELTHLKLYPGEVIRTPLIVLQFWEGKYVDSQNTWRRWMIAHNTPRPNGKLPQPMFCASSWDFTNSGTGVTEDNQIMFISRHLEENLNIDCWWIDAGWYPCDGNWGITGTWESDKKRFPNGLRPVSNYLHSKNIKLILWFEPERVRKGTWLYENHPEWLISTKPNPKDKLLNLGNPDALKWLIEHVDHLIIDDGIDIYRQDFNFEPLKYWRANDTENRQGITENYYVQGYLTYWDELRKRHPNLLIDSCSSGGRRNDLETLRRSIPLLRSDYVWEPIGNQCHTYGLSYWFPFFGSPFYNDANRKITPYLFRSVNCPVITGGLDVRMEDLDYDLLRHLIHQWRQISHYYMGDYYPLTPYSLDKDVWIGWQFHKPDSDEGMIQVFRRDENPSESMTFQLNGLTSNKNYILTNLDTNGTETVSGKDLLTTGLKITLKRKPSSALIVYRQE